MYSIIKLRKIYKKFYRKKRECKLAIDCLIGGGRQAAAANINFTSDLWNGEKYTHSGDICKIKIKIMYFYYKAVQ